MLFVSVASVPLHNIFVVLHQELRRGGFSVTESGRPPKRIKGDCKAVKIVCDSRSQNELWLTLSSTGFTDMSVTGNSRDFV